MKTSLIIIDGQNGAGKSTVAKLLHTKIKNTAIIHWDNVKKLVSDFKPNDRDRNIAAQVARAMAQTYLKNNVSVIYETYFGKAEYLNAVLALAGKQIRVFIYQLEAPFDVRHKRIKLRQANTPKHKIVLTKARLIRNDKLYSKSKYLKAKVIDSTHMTPEKIVAEILKNLK
jgi:predicted ABC-type ATPase